MLCGIILGSAQEPLPGHSTTLSVLIAFEYIPLHVTHATWTLYLPGRLKLASLVVSRSEVNALLRFGRIQISKMRLVVLSSLVACFAAGSWSLCSDNKCGDCVSGLGCRWCTKTNTCHVWGSWFNRCDSDENISDRSQCSDEPPSPRYDPELSLKMLLLSSAAYDPQHPQECLNNALPSSNFILTKVVIKDCDMFDHECTGFVAISHVHKAIAVVFRGTFELTQGLVQFLGILSTPKTSFLGGQVQRYWKNAFDLLWQDMDGEVKAQVSAYPSYQIWVTGHSLGGALASLASAWIAYNKIVPQEDIILYTFGMPRVGNYWYAKDHDELVKNSWRVVNYDDTIPHFPTLVSLSFLNGPYHHGVEVFYSEVATSVYSEHKECHGMPYNEDATCSLFKIGLTTDHHTDYFGIRVGSFFESDCVR